MHWNVAPDALLDLQGLYVFWTAGLTTANAHTMYWGKILPYLICQSHELLSRKLWVELASCYVHMHVHARMCQNFHCAKKLWE